MNNTLRQTLTAAAIFALAVATFSSRTADAAVIYSNFGVGDSYNNLQAPVTSGTGSSFASFIRVAGRFTPSATYTLDSAELPLVRYEGVGNMSVDVVSDGGVVPGATVLETASLTNVAGSGIRTFTFGSSVTLNAGTQYWVVLRPTSPSGNELVSWFINNTGVNGYASRSDNAAWGGTGSTAPAFRVNGSFATVIPEVGTLALLGIGGSGFGVVVRRRRTVATVK